MVTWAHTLVPGMAAGCWYLLAALTVHSLPHSVHLLVTFSAQIVGSLQQLKFQAEMSSEGTTVEHSWAPDPSCPKLAGLWQCDFPW